MPRSRSASPKRPQAEETPVEPSPANNPPTFNLTREAYLLQVTDWLGEPKVWKDCWYSHKINWNPFFDDVVKVLRKGGVETEFTFAKFVVGLVKATQRMTYGAYELQFAVDVVIAPDTDKEIELSDQFFAEIPELAKKHGVDNLQFWFELSERGYERKSYIRQQGNVYKMETTNPLTPYNNRYFFGHKGITPKLDPTVARMAKEQQKIRMYYEKYRAALGQPSKDECSEQTLNALYLCTHVVLNTLPETLREGPVTLPTINGKNPLSEEIAAAALAAGIDFDVETNTFK